MKKIFLFMCGLFLSSISFGQGSIIGFTIDPQSPTVTDFVKVYANLSFTSGDCPLDNKNHTTLGSVTNAYTHHCVGMLAVICNRVDTFELGYLPVGNHKFRLVLTSGGGFPPCTPGIVADDNDSTTFIVGAVTGINERDLNKQKALIYPNPMSDYAKIIINHEVSLIDTEIRLIDVFGRVVKNYKNLEKNEIVFSRDNLCQGIYFYYLTNKESIIALGKLVIE